METINVSPLTLADFEDGTVTEGLKVYWRREHAGEITYDPATLIRVNLPQIVEEQSSTRQWTPTGDGRWYKQMGSATVESKYGTQTTYASAQCSDIAIADPEGEEVTLTPEYGSAATLTVTMPGASPEELQQALEAFMGELVSIRVTSVNVKPLADRRINIYENNEGRPGAAIARGVLEGEALHRFGYIGSITEQVSGAEHAHNMALLRETLLREGTVTA